MKATFYLFLAVFVREAIGQTCSVATTGACAGGAPCPSPTDTCLAPSSTCCPPASVVTTTTTTTVATTTAAATTVAATTVATTKVATTAAPCVDLLNPNTGVSDCPRLSYLCTDANYRTLMAQQCRLTCGYCTGGGGTGTANCVDLLNPSTGVSDCPPRAYLCTNSVYYTLMTQQCPRTCGRCSGSSGTGSSGSGASSTCVDLLNPSTGVSDCPSRAYLCTNTAYYTLMTQQCPRTCGRCSG